MSLLAPTLSAAQRMLNVCSDFAEEFQLMFNGSMSQSLVLGSSAGPSSLTSNGTIIPFVEQASHLGHIIGKDAPQKNITNAVRDLIIRSNVLSMNYSFVHFEHLRILFNAYCGNFYGCQFWNMSRYISWRKCVRKVFMLSPRTHSIYLPYIVSQSAPLITCMKRTLSFYLSLHRSTNIVVKTCMRTSASGLSVFDENLRLVMSKLQINYVSLNARIGTDMHVFIKKLMSIESPLSDETQSLIFTILELCSCRSGDLSFAFNRQEIDLFLQYLCTC